MTDSSNPESTGRRPGEPQASPRSTLPGADAPDSVPAAHKGLPHASDAVSVGGGDGFTVGGARDEQAFIDWKMCYPLRSVAYCAATLEVER